MDLTTNYLGLKLANPLMPGSSPMAKTLDTIKKMEDAGAGAIVLHSLFEEQLRGEQFGSIYQMEMFADSFSEAQSYFPTARNFALGPDEYLEYIQQVKKSCKLPLIASLNGNTMGGWIEHSKLIEQAGADALEINLYTVATDPLETGEKVEQRLLEVVGAIKKTIKIPLAVKLSPFFTSLPNLCCKLNDLDVAGIVLFNRFYQPDIDLDLLEAVPKLVLSNSSELLLRLRWLAIVSPHVKCTMAVSGGVHTPVDAIKAIMTGASGVQVCSALLKNGPEYIGTLLQGIKEWMTENEYDSVRLMQGSMNLMRCPDPHAFERANYMRILQSWSNLDGAL